MNRGCLSQLNVWKMGGEGEADFQVTQYKDIHVFFPLFSSAE